MPSTVRTFITAALMTIVATAFLAPGPAGAAATKNDVRVVNTPAEAVPVTGTVGVLGTVPVSQSGQWSVQVEDQSTLDAFQTQFSGQIEEGFSNNCSTIDVPSGKRLVIEYVSFSGNAFQDENFQNLQIDSVVDGVDVVHSVPIEPVEGIDPGVWQASDGNVHIYADPGAEDETTLGICVTRDGTHFTAFFGSLSGYLLDMP